MDSPEYYRPTRELWLYPTLEDLTKWGAALGDTDLISFDIETRNKQITCIGFSPHAGLAMCLPFWSQTTPGGSYWTNYTEEVHAWKWVREILTNDTPKVAQNGLYDIQYLWRKMHIPVLNYAHDTMLAHHAVQPEVPKSLDFLASIYTNEPSWKSMRSEHDLFKRDA
jgi:DNA polymerase I-like protein with 3'-5' exonuclease and polymerase domains